MPFVMNGLIFTTLEKCRFIFQENVPPPVDQNGRGSSFRPHSVGVLHLGRCESSTEPRGGPGPEKGRGMLNPSSLHLLAGGFGATVGACVTCPLDVVQTRLQSTLLSMNKKNGIRAVVTATALHGGAAHLHLQGNFVRMMLSYMRFMVHTEGIKSLFKGLLPSVLGIAPAKAVYFFVYSSTKMHLNSHDYRYIHPNSHTCHSLSAMAAGIMTSTVTNPVWFIKTRLQLDRTRSQRFKLFNCIAQAYSDHGFFSFFRGLSASYVGVLETIIYFIIYEDIKKHLRASHNYSGVPKTFHTTDFIFASVASKVTATLMMYPHEVVRTRLRQDVVDSDTGQLKYRGFFQTLIRVAREEGRLGLYGGFATNIFRQIPNTAVTFLTYESIIYFLGHEE